MISTSLQALTGATNDVAAWDKLFHYYNSTHSRGDLGYATNETIALKINCNNCYSGYGDVDDQIDASPQSVLAMLRQLVNKAGVAEDRITVYEAVRVSPDRIYNPCHAEFPNVVWLDSQGNGSNGRQPVTWHANAFSYSGTSYLANSIPEAVCQANYIVNLSPLKGHWHAGVSLTAKNHLGTISGAPHNHTCVDSYLSAHEHLSPLRGLYRHPPTRRQDLAADDGRPLRHPGSHGCGQRLDRQLEQPLQRKLVGQLFPVPRSAGH